MQLENRRVLITGASGGIGQALAAAFLLRGARVILSSRGKERLQTLQRRLGAAPDRVELQAADLLQQDGPERLAEQTLAEGRAVDVLVNCAGTPGFGRFEQTSPAEIELLWQLNVVAPMRLSRALLPSMLARGEGRIVNIGSIFGSIGFPCYATYSATKFAIRGFSEALRRELAGTGVGVTYAAPRYTRTGFNEGAAQRAASALKMAQDDPATVADRIATAVERDRAELYIGRPESLFVRLNALLPRLVDGALAKQGRALRSYADEAQTS